MHILYINVSVRYCLCQLCNDRVACLLSCMRGDPSSCCYPDNLNCLYQFLSLSTIIDPLQPPASLLRSYPAAKSGLCMYRLHARGFSNCIVVLTGSANSISSSVWRLHNNSCDQTRIRSEFHLSLNDTWHSLPVFACPAVLYYVFCYLTSTYFVIVVEQ